MLHQRLILVEYGVKLRFIQGIKNEEAGMLSRKEFVNERENTVSTKAFEFMTLGIHINEMSVPLDYETFFVH